jgi:hypothetical protein
MVIILMGFVGVGGHVLLGSIGVHGCVLLGSIGAPSRFSPKFC